MTRVIQVEITKALHTKSQQQETKCSNKKYMKNNSHLNAVQGRITSKPQMFDKNKMQLTQGARITTVYEQTRTVYIRGHLEADIQVNYDQPVTPQWVII